MESSAALPHAARELLLKGGGCAVNFECAPELCAPLRAELARSGRSVGFVRADEGFYDRMDTAAYLRLFERMAGTRGMADAALAAKKNADTLAGQKPKDYQSGFTAQLEALYQEISSRPGFSPGAAAASFVTVRSRSPARPCGKPSGPPS